jgi:DNA-directed RNA polymerase specialized sigma24 family protein
MPDNPEDTPTQVFAGHRELLFSIVYNLLGNVADTEDVLQDTWLSWVPRNQASGAEEITNPDKLSRIQDAPEAARGTP